MPERKRPREEIRGRFDAKPFSKARLKFLPSGYRSEGNSGEIGRSCAFNLSETALRIPFDVGDLLFGLPGMYLSPIFSSSLSK
jgi:hypothetical protein